MPTARLPARRVRRSATRLSCVQGRLSGVRSHRGRTTIFCLNDQPEPAPRGQGTDYDLCVDPTLAPPQIDAVPAAVRGEPPPRHGGALALLRFMRARGMLMPEARLLRLAGCARGAQTDGSRLSARA